MTEMEKEKIDYEIQAKISARDKSIADWGCALILAVFFLLVMYFAVKVFIK